MIGDLNDKRFGNKISPLCNDPNSDCVSYAALCTYLHTLRVTSVNCVSTI